MSEMHSIPGDEFVLNSWLRRKTRPIRYLWQRVSRGFSDAETFSLDHTIAEFALPRLKRFKEVNNGCPNHVKSSEEWDRLLDNMIFALDKVTKQLDLDRDDLTAKEEEKVRQGLTAFGFYFRELWW